MRISIFVLIAALAISAAVPAMADFVNGTCDQGSVSVSATGSGGTGNSGTALTGWVYSLSATPYGNWYIGTNVSTWNQRPGYTVAGVGSIFHANPTGKTAGVTQSVTGLVPGALYRVSGWLLPVLVAGKPSGATLALAVQNPDSPGWIWAPTYGGNPGEAGVWGNFNLDVTASAAGVVDVRIYITMGAGGWTTKSTPNAAWDDFTITMVPEPGSLLGLAAGLPAFAFFLRRRR